MSARKRKWAILATAGSITGILMLLLFRSIPIAAGSATAIIVAMILLKHLALMLIVGSPLAAAFQGLKPKIREHCPFAKF